MHKSGQYPITSVGMELLDNNIDVSGQGRGLSVVYPNTGEHVKTGIYPNTQASARYSSVEINAEAEGEGHIYHSKLTGTDPKVSVRSAESDNGVFQRLPQRRIKSDTSSVEMPLRYKKGGMQMKLLTKQGNPGISRLHETGTIGPMRSTKSVRLITRRRSNR